MQRPFGTFIVSKLFVPTRTWHFVRLELNVAHWGDLLHKRKEYFSRKARSKALRMEAICLNEGRQVVSGWRRHHMQRILIKVQISLLPVAKGGAAIFVFLDSRDLIEVVAAG